MIGTERGTKTSPLVRLISTAPMPASTPATSTALASSTSSSSEA